MISVISLSQDLSPKFKEFFKHDLMSTCREPYESQIKIRCWYTWPVSQTARVKLCPYHINYYDIMIINLDYWCLWGLSMTVSQLEVDYRHICQDSTSVAYLNDPSDNFTVSLLNLIIRLFVERQEVERWNANVWFIDTINISMVGQLSWEASGCFKFFPTSFVIL